MADAIFTPHSVTERIYTSEIVRSFSNGINYGIYFAPREFPLLKLTRFAPVVHGNEAAQLMARFTLQFKDFQNWMEDVCKLWPSFGQGYPYTYVKLRVDILDKENMIYAYMLIDGDALSDKIEFVSNEMKLEPSLDGGCIGKFTSKYHAKEGADINEEDIKAGKHWCLDLFKVVEAYLLANPDAYV
ncbi:major allergen Pru ar 1-like [Actinidia eriantha]|uniref:major allergen Pru ar 1-like n=1 Tax=Actinidia eriantha TaxID=165200 RepID=UPI00258E163F|nr:major allergen Pru ar 1-like [Actinidia eriantha]